MIPEAINPAVVSKVHKLLALSRDGGATEAEATLAAEMAQKIMAEHNLSMAVVEAAGGSSGAEGKRTKEGVNRKQVYKWQRTLMEALGKLNYCHVETKWRYRNNQSSIFDGYELIGRTSNVIACQQTFEYLLQTIERLAREEVMDPSQYFTRYAHSFKEGCADRIIERVRERHEQIVAEQERQVREEQARRSHPSAAPSNLPMVILRDYESTEKDLNNDHRNGWEPGTTARRRAERDAEWAKHQEHAAAKYEVALRRYLDAGHSPEMADLLAKGWDLEDAHKHLNPKPETEAQRRRRTEREERASERFWERVRRRQERDAARLDHTGYQRGKAAGASVGLDDQLDEDRKRRLR